MGRLILPTSGTVYTDANIALYSIHSHPIYARVCAPLWEAAQLGAIIAVSSELTLMETLVGPLRSGDTAKAMISMNFWNRPGAYLLPITKDILIEAARLRASIPGLKTPDAIHAATAILHGCALFVTNDLGSKRVPNLPLAILDDAIAAAS